MIYHLTREDLSFLQKLASNCLSQILGEYYVILSNLDPSREVRFAIKRG